jgi:hypothetical protein
MVVAFLLPQSASAEAAVTSFNIWGRGALVHAYVSVPEAFLPFTVEGGVFESYGKIESLPHAFGYAGAVPVPIATSAGIVLPEGIPENIREGIRSVDYKALPNYCQADFPASKDKGEESYCGGPAQPQESLALTGAAVNGHVKATGDYDDPGKTSILSESRAVEVGVPGIQSRILGGATSFRSFVNDEGIPIAEASAHIESLNVLGSLVRFDQVESSANVVNDGTEGGSAGRVSLTIAGATVAGIPVRVTSEGVTVSEPVQGMSPQQATEAVNKSLADAGGASVRILPGSGIHRDGNRLIAQSPSLVVEYNSQTPTPAHVIEEFGLAEINALAQGPRRPAADLPLTDNSGSSPAASDGGGAPPTTQTDERPAPPLVREASSEPVPAVADDVSAPGSEGPGIDLSTPAPEPADSGPPTGGVSLSNSLGDQSLLAQPAFANPALVRPSPWVRAWYLLLAGLVPVAAVVNAALKPRARSLRRGGDAA